ncbi:uncharacterized protein LOC129335043 [Eublepharis macularius]|uniref:ribonuclease H n=1 Tax=Eublepharis macularius TaxID=481883 RepID=A0AA97JSQ1_EUBMA|nr:uncharacterized protein LOC129335043 [Eublepharis macularius]
MPKGKAKGPSKGKQAAKKPAAKRVVPALSSSDEEDGGVPISQILARIAALEKARSVPPATSGGTVRQKSSRLATKSAFRRDILTRLSALEESAGVTAGSSSGDVQAAGEVLEVQEASGTEQAWAEEGGPLALAVEPPVAESAEDTGKNTSTPQNYSWPWGPWPQGVPSTLPGHSQALGSQAGSSQALATATVHSPWSQPNNWGQFGAAAPSGHGQSLGSQVNWYGGVPHGASGQPAVWQAYPPGGWNPQIGTVSYGMVPFNALPFGDTALPLGDHLTQATREKILRGEYVDIFTLLFRELEKKDKEDLDERDKEKLKRRKVDRNWHNWLPGMFIYAGVIARAQPWRAAPLFQYMDIIYKGYTEFSGTAWMQYDEEFRMRAALNPAMQWDRIHQQLWLQGFEFGFRIPFRGNRVPFMSPNLKSVVGMEEVVRAKIAKECAEGRVLGPFPSPPVPCLRVSPLGVVPKKAAGEFRLIHHLSYPRGSSVNDAIPEHLCSVRYTSFDQAVKVVRRCGVGAEMAKCDIKSAFRLLPVHPDDFELLGFSFEGQFYMDRALPMGCSISCASFERFSSFLEWALKHRLRCFDACHYLDDYLFVGPEGSGQCARLLAGFIALAEELGVPLAHEKTEGPVTVLTFLGIELDTRQQASRLPMEKLRDLRARLASFQGKRKVSLLELQQLVGHLNFACRVVAPGRAFLRRLCEAMSKASKPNHRIRITRDMRADIQVWEDFLGSFNGVSFWREDVLLEAELQVTSDASGSTGFGVYFRGHWCAEQWPAEWAGQGLTRDLTFLEFFPILVAVCLWGKDLANHSVHFWCDNMAVVQVVNSLSSKSRRVMRLVRVFTLQCLRLNILFRAKHVPGVSNCIADALSRLQMARFRQLAPEADLQPALMPQFLWQIGEQKRAGPFV